MNNDIHDNPGKLAPAEKLYTFRNPWFTGSIAALVLVMLASAAVGFIWLPKAQSRNTLASLWDDICSATGVVARFAPPTLPVASQIRSSNVIVMPGMMAPADSQSIGRGATLAMQCTMCHGARGMSVAEAPHLAGQPAAATYKQLRDFKSGHRLSAIMQPMVASLGDNDMRDLAAYYAFLPRERAADSGAGEVQAPELVSNGAPMRNIGACSTCHAEGIHKTGTPSLDGQPEVYLQAQLRAFVRGTRHNDINAQMRNATRRMTPEEISAAAGYYARR